MIPRFKDASVFDMFHGETDDLVSLIQREFNGKERLFDFDSYFDHISLEDFKDSAMSAQSYFYKDNINLFVRHYFMASEYADFSQEKLSEEKEFIEKNFTGDLKKYAIARMIWDYNLKGFGYSEENIAYMKSIIEEYKNEFTDKSSKETMAKIQEELSTFNFKLSDLALNTKLVSKYGDTLTVKDIFDQSNKRIRVVDFWASWCPPCISEIKTTKKFKDKLSVENNVEWIYLSLDEDEKKWIERSNELEEYLNVRHQYLVLGGWKSNLATSLKVNGVPRYVVFDRQNKIVLDNAPRASDTIVFNKIVESIK